MNAIAEVSQRLVRKGALASDTYRAFQEWESADTPEVNLKRFAEGQFSTAAWGNEITTTLRRRFRNARDAEPLIMLAKKGLPFDEWRTCLLIWVGLREELFRQFVITWLYSQFDTGTLRVRVDDVRPFVKSFWRTTHDKSKDLTEYGEVRTARDLLRMSRDLGLLHGDGPDKTFRSHHLSDRCFLFWAHAIAVSEGSPSKVPHSASWRLGLMRPSDVEHELLRLHQFRKLEYHVAGSLVQLTLPGGSFREYVEWMVE